MLSPPHTRSNLAPRKIPSGGETNIDIFQVTNSTLNGSDIIPYEFGSSYDITPNLNSFDFEHMEPGLMSDQFQDGFAQAIETTNTTSKTTSKLWL